MIRIWTDDNPTKRTLPTPSGYTWTYSDLDKNSGRDDYGKMVRNRLASKRKLELSWNADKDPAINALMIKILMSLPPFFYCEFVDGDNSVQTMECYRGDIKRTLFRYDPNTNSIWKESTVNFIER